VAWLGAGEDWGSVAEGALTTFLKVIKTEQKEAMIDTKNLILSVSSKFSIVFFAKKDNGTLC